ncbi:CvpA family protein [bacterium]|nr:CvpA family protein [bacterium]
MLNSLDVIIIVVVMAGAYWGSIRGLLAEMIATVGVVVGILSASQFYLFGAEVLLPLLRDPKITNFIAFLTLYLISILIFFLIHLVIKSNMSGGVVLPASRLFAALIGGLKSAVFVSMILFLVIFLWGPDNSLTTGSKLLSYTLPRCQPVLTLLPEDMQEPLTEYLEELALEIDDEGEGDN